MDRMAVYDQKYRSALVFQQTLQKSYEPVGIQFAFDRHEAYGAFGADR